MRRPGSMSRKITLIVCALLGLAAAAVVLAAQSGIAVYVNGQRLHDEAILVKGRTYLPVQAFAEALGAAAHYDRRARTLSIKVPRVGLYGFLVWPLDESAVAACQEDEEAPEVTYEIYSTQQGDTAVLVAARTGVNVIDLCAWNHITSTDLLDAGRSLLIYHSREKPQGQVVGRLGVVKAASLTIRSRRGGGSILYRVKRGAQLCVCNQKDGYYGIQMGNGNTGWVPASALDVQNVQILVPPGARK